jgi:hypothetical protein
MTTSSHKQHAGKPDDTRPSRAKAQPGEPDERNLAQHPRQTAEVPLGSGSKPEASGQGGFGSHSSEPGGQMPPHSDLPATSDRHKKPASKK